MLFDGRRRLSITDFLVVMFLLFMLKPFGFLGGGSDTSSLSTLEVPSDEVIPLQQEEIKTSTGVKLSETRLKATQNLGDAPKEDTSIVDGGLIPIIIALIFMIGILYWNKKRIIALIKKPSTRTKLKQMQKEAANAKNKKT